MPRNLVKITRQIKSLARTGNVNSARKLFDEMHQRDIIAWNTMLSSYSHLGLYQKALFLFLSLVFNISPDDFSFTSVLSACSGALEIEYGLQVHAKAVVFCCDSFLPVNNALVNMYGKCLRPFCADKVFREMGLRNNLSWCSLLFAYTNSFLFEDSRRVFDAMPNKGIVAWNTMIAGYARYGESALCFGIFKEMLSNSYRPDQWTFSAVMNVCAESKDLFFGCLIHSMTFKSGWSLAVEASNSILSFYAKVGSKDDFIKINGSIKVLTQVSFNTIIDAYMKFGEPQEACLVFQEASDKNIISWTSMISGYAKNGEEELALSFFVAMMRDCCRPDDFAFGAVLQACSNLTTLKHGHMVHSLVIRYGFHAYAYVGNGLINMYAKCGDISNANEVFSDIFDKDLVSWNALLFAFAFHGQAARALSLYEDMSKIGVTPDKVTFMGLLVSCSHSGLIEKGKALFASMSCIYGISPEIDHVVCVVDMLARGGYLEEAGNFARNYAKIEPNIAFNEAILGACSCHGDLTIGAILGGELQLLNPQNEMNYVLLSNLYSASGQWAEVETIRKLMVEKNVMKIPGCSWIEVENRVITFRAGINSNTQFEVISETLCALEQGMRNPCFSVKKVE